jgi:hypothetical protein
MNRHKIEAVGKLALGIGGVAVGLMSALFGTFREMFFSAEVESARERRLHDSDLMGEYNHRTGRLDAGVDPHGWYDED